MKNKQIQSSIYEKRKHKDIVFLFLFFKKKNKNKERYQWWLMRALIMQALQPLQSLKPSLNYK